MIEISFGDIDKDEEYYSKELDKCFISSKMAEYILSIKNRVNSSSRTQSLCALYELAQLLNKNGMDTTALEIKKTPYGKPYFANSDIHFSISHTSTKFAVAICDSPIGIDVEDKILSEERMQGIARRYFADVEISLVNDRESFLKIWTYKEAYAKMQGVPLSEIIGQISSDTSTINKIYNEYNGAVICTCY